MKLTLDEVKLVVAEMLDEAKKKKEKAEELKKKGRSIEAYGLYDEAFDFAAPLGADNTYAQQGAVNWGPYTSPGPQIDSAFHDPQPGRTAIREERALRMLVREVIQNGLVPSNSAWAPLVESERQPCYESPWDAAQGLFEAWYDREASKRDGGDGKKTGLSQLKGKTGEKKDPAKRSNVGRKKK